MSLAVIGTLAYDSVETAHDSRENALGGSAMYCAVAAAPYTKPRLVGVVGGDFKDEHIEPHAWSRHLHRGTRGHPRGQDVPLGWAL